MAEKKQDIQCIVPYSQLVELLALPQEGAELRKQLAKLERRLEGNDRIHYDIIHTIGEIKKQL